MAAAEVTAISAYSVVHAIGNTALGGTYDGFRMVVYQPRTPSLLDIAPATAAAAVARPVPTNALRIPVKLPRAPLRRAGSDLPMPTAAVGHPD